MFRTLATLIVAGSIAPAAVFAAGSSAPAKTNTHTTGATATKTVTSSASVKTTSKVDVNKGAIGKTVVDKHKVDAVKTTTTTGKAAVDTSKVDASKKFPKLNNGYQPKVSQATIAKHTPKNFDKNYHVNHGTKFAHGYCYHGKDHHHWSFCCWDSHCGCHTYWCPCTCCFYYYCEPACCFYPVTYCPYQTYCWSSCYVVPSIVVVPCDHCGCS